jgi:hypothetical protein
LKYFLKVQKSAEIHFNHGNSRRLGWGVLYLKFVQVLSDYFFTDVFSLKLSFFKAMYFGQSFGRIGSDFRLSLIPIFTDALRDLTLGQLAGAEERFRNGMYNLALKANVAKTRDDQVIFILYMMLMQRSQVRQCLLKSKMEVYIQRRIG